VLCKQQVKARGPVTLLMFDLDHFKSINDRFGHATGDEALRVFARSISSALRLDDVIGRLGGEEFAAIVGASAADSVKIAERVRAGFEAAGLTIDGHAIGASVSIGTATALAADGPIEWLLSRADAALYVAKKNGRNRVEAAPPFTEAEKRRFTEKRGQATQRPQPHPDAAPHAA
jgi:diguanylate cyclase (GGDEF)-like protein